MLSDSIRRWNPWWADGKVAPELIGTEREKLGEIKRYLNLRQIKDIIGVRRSGKTFLLYQITRHLISSGVDPKNIVHLNFDGNDIYNSDFSQLLLECRRLNPDLSHIFLDEVQEKKGWERWIRMLYDTNEFKSIFISGSSAGILKSDIARVLTGRHAGFVLFPFSFKEYLLSHGWKEFSAGYLEHNKGKLMHLLESYIRGGGFPETLGMNEFERTKYLNDLFDDIVSKDVAARHNADYQITKRIAYYVTSHSSKTMTYRSVARACDVSADTVSKYIPFLSEAFLVLPLKLFSSKLKEQMREVNKYYCIDTGMVEAVGFKMTDEFARLMENIVFIELNRRCAEDKKSGLFYWQDSNQKEVDFLVKEGLKVSKLIQVCYDARPAETRKRELAGLVAALDEFKLESGSIVTWDQDEVEKIRGKTIRYIPLWKWLLES